MVKLPDAATRLEAVKDFEHNLVVVAGAGTGKTSLLVGRLASALIRHHYEPRQVLALTFTENAAAEMRERLERLLTAALRIFDCSCTEDGCDCPANRDGIDASDRATIADLELSAENRSRIVEVLETIDEVPLSTFHGFCARLLRQHAQLLSLPPDQVPGADELARPDFDEAFLDFLRELDPNVQHPALERFEASDLGNLAWRLRRLPAEGIEELTAPPPKLSDDAATMLQASLSDLRDEWMDAEGIHKSTHAKFLAQLDALRAVVDALIAGDPVPPHRWPSRSAISVGSSKKEDSQRLREHARTVFEHCQTTVEPYARSQDEDIAEAVRFLTPFVRRTHAMALEQGVFTFDELILETRSRLMHNAAFRRAVNSELRAILVDEFQDTDPLQYDIVFMLASDPAVEGSIERPLDCKLRPNLLFIVGDPKQSIYRFRRADITAFGQASNRVLDQNGRSHSLTANFRSRRAILDEVNRIGAVTLAEQPPYQLGYEAVVPMIADDDAVVERLVPVDLDPPAPADGAAAQDAPPSAPRRRALEGSLCVSLIEELHNGGVGYDEIAILLRKTTETTALLRPLRSAGIPFVLTGSKRFYERQEILLATAVITAVARPHDRVAVLGVLRSAFSAATDRSVFDYLQAHDGSTSLDPRAVPDTAQGPVADTLRWLDSMHSRCLQLPVEAAIETVFDLDAWAIIEGSSFEGAQSLANLDRLRSELLRAQPIDLAAAAEFLEQHTRRGTDDEESPLTDASRAAVRIMTVHGSKGLEFGAVILPDLGGQAGGNRGFTSNVNCQRAALADGRTAVGVRIGDARNFADFALEAEEAHHADAEADRLLYVALTRAKRSLHLIEAQQAGAGSWQQRLEEQSLLDPITARSIAVEVERGQRRDFGSADATARVDTDRVSPDRVVTAWRAQQDAVAATAPTPSEVSAPPKPRAGSRPAAAEQLAASAAAMAFGTAVHRYLAIADITQDFDLALCTECAQIERTDLDSLRDCVEALHGGSLADRLTKAERTLREVPVSYLDADGRPAFGVLDLLLAEADGSWTIIDHKTDRIEADAGEATLRSMAENHRSQLERYADGLRRTLNLDAAPACAVHFVRRQEIVSLSPAADG